MYLIVDPIDGTTNFIKDYHTSCISVGIINDGIKAAGVVYNPYLNEMYYAIKGEGAFLNDKRIHVSDEPLSNGIVLFGTSPYYEELNEKSFEMAFDYFKKALDIRRSGSAAIDLCSIAAGRAEVYFELRLSPWDYAAASLILTEAGGYFQSQRQCCRWHFCNRSSCSKHTTKPQLFAGHSREAYSLSLCGFMVLFPPHYFRVCKKLTGFFQTFYLCLSSSA